MARTYTDSYFYRCETVEYTVKVPTPKEFQARTDGLKDVYGNEVRIVITNMSYDSPISGKREKYAVAMFEQAPESQRETWHDDAFWNLIKWETKAKGHNVLVFEGKHARAEVVAAVGNLLRHY